MFITEEKVQKKIQQDRLRGDLKRARARALDALKKWPDNINLAMEAIQACVDLADFHQAVSLLKTILRRHPKRRSEVLEYSRELFMASFNPFFGSFLIDILLREKNIEEIEGILRRSPESFINDLIKRSETRSKSHKEEGLPPSADNELLLGLLYKLSNQVQKATAPLGRALEINPDSAQLIGSILVELEREHPNSAAVKFYLGLVSITLSHPNKAETRFFQSLELDNPPLEKLQQTVESMREVSENLLLLKGEILIRSGKSQEGVDLIRLYLSDQGDAPHQEQQPPGMKHLFPLQKDREDLAGKRLLKLPAETLRHPDVTFLYCDVEVSLGHVKKAIEALENLYQENNKSAPEIIDWIEENEDVSLTGPAKKLLTELYLKSGDHTKAAEAARMAADMDSLLLSSVLELIRREVEGSTERDPILRALLAELYARSGDGESAEEVLKDLQSNEVLENKELLNLSGEIMKHAGVTLSGVTHALEASIKSGNVYDAVPYVFALYREQPDDRERLAGEIRRFAEENPDYWRPVSELLDLMAQEESLSKSFRFLQALTHLQEGRVEKAVFEFDQLLMMDQDIRSELIEIYEKAVERYHDNTTLHLAMYQLHWEEEHLVEAAHFLCRTLELDPSQIRDVLIRFDNLIEKEPENVAIWEEMLKTSLKMSRLSLTKEILKRAISTLPKDNSAALHIYGAKVSIADNKLEDALRCLAVTLTSQRVDLRSIEEQLENILMREPSNQEARYLLGETYLRLGREEEAVAAFRDCLELSAIYRKKIREDLEQLLPMSIQPWLLSRTLGEIAWIEKRFEDAYRYFTSALKGPRESLTGLSDSLRKLRIAAPDDRHLAFLSARAFLLNKRYGESVAVLEELVNTDAQSVKPVMELLLELLDAEPSQFEANRLLAQLTTRMGEGEKSLEFVIRMLTYTEIDPQRLDEIVDEFRPVHDKNSLFLIPYASLKARKKEGKEALANYKRALEIDPESWNRILGEMETCTWPEELVVRSILLKIDCLVHGELFDESFDLLKEIPTVDPEITGEVITRISTLIEKKPAKQLFSFGSYLHARAGDLEKARHLIERGCEALRGDDCRDLKIELAEIFQSHGRVKEARRLFTEVLSQAEEKEKILKQIEDSYCQLTEREISAARKRIDEGKATDEEVAAFIKLTLDCHRSGEALEILTRSTLEGRERIKLLAHIYLSKDRPALALAALGAVEKKKSTPDDIEMFYLEGIASERIGDYGRASAAFSKIVGTIGDYLDSRSRAERNYVTFIESQFAGKVETLEKVGSL